MSLPGRRNDELGGAPQTAPRISVIMPVYNAEALLAECLAALRANQGADYEILVVDDSSTDRSREIAAAAGCRVIPSGGRLGPAGARNKGVAEATGDVLFFVDSDVMVRPDTLPRLAAAFADDPNLDGVIAVQAPAMRFRNLCSRYKNLWMYYTYARRAGEDVPLFYTTAAAIRRRTFVDSGGFDLNYTNPNVEDTDFGQKLGRLGYRIRVLPELQVEHVKGYDLRGLLRVDFLRSMSLARLKLRKRADAGAANDTSVPTGYIASVPLAGLAAVLLVAALLTGGAALLATSLVAIAAIFMLNVPFLRLLRLHGGVTVWTLGAGLLLIELLAAGIGSAYGIATFIAGKKY
jgi:GT2 family glycosyltransferase